MPITTCIPPEFFPNSIQELADVIGLHNALALVKAYGGTRLAVPKLPATKPDLLSLLGEDSYKTLARSYGGETLEIPRCAKLMTLARDIEILHGRRRKLGCRELAAQFAMTERGIQKALRRVENIERKPWFKELQTLTTTLTEETPA